MQLNENLAWQIVHRAMKILSFSVNVMDANGYIIASGDPARRYQRHEGAVLALLENRVVEISARAADALKGVRPGINLPIAYQSQLVGVIGLSGDPDEVRAYAELVRMTAELMLEQAALTEQLQWDRRHQEEWVLQLLRGESSPAELRQTARLLGLEVDAPRVVAILRPEEATPARLRELVHLLEVPARDNLVALNGLEEVVVLKPVQLVSGHWDSAQERSKIKQFMRKLPNFKCKIAVGSFFPGLAGLAQSYQTARATLRVGRQQAPTRSVYFFSDYRLPVLLDGLAHSWQADELRSPLLALKQSDSKGVLQKTLRSYFAQNCDLTRCAAQLFIHPNTLRYRLAKIEQITGLYFNNLDDKFSLYLSFNLLR
ncbi:MAG: sugar diacid recognition domain-containing protein [Aeromonas sp.]